MNLPSKLVALSALTVAISPAFAAQRADLTITGYVGLPACDIDLKQPQLDFGNLSRDQISGTAPYSMTSQTVEADVKCGADSQIALSIIDNKATQLRPDVPLPFNTGTGAPVSMARDLFFTLTNYNSKPIGAYTITARNANVDALTNLPVTTWKLGTALGRVGRDIVVPPGYLVAPATIGFPATPTQPEAPASVMRGSTFSFFLTVAPTLLDSTQLPTGSSFKIEGSAALEVKYL